VGGVVHQAALTLTLLAACGGGTTSGPVEHPDPTDGTRSPDDPPPGKSEQEQKDEDDAAIIAIEQAVNQLNGPIHHCWARAAADDYRLGGHVVLAVKVGVGGKTDEVVQVEDSTGDPVLVQCLVALWKKYAWPAEAIAPGETVQLPMEFGSPEAQYTVSTEHVAPRPLGPDGPAAASKAQVVLHADNTGNDSAALTVLEMAPGLEVPLHRHTSVEVIYILSGKGMMTDLGGKPRPVGPGDAVFIPRGVGHGLKNTGSQPVVAVQLYAPGGPEQRFLGKPPVGTEPVAAGEKKKGPRPVIRSTRSGKSAKLAGGKRLSLFDPGPVFLGALQGQPGMEMKLEADPAGSWFWYLLEGGGVLSMNGQEIAVGAGDAIQVPSGIRRGFRAGEAGVKALQFRVDGDPNSRWKPK
jgi:quercetin dioxygenase-like cupin family protein